MCWWIYVLASSAYDRAPNKFIGCARKEAVTSTIDCMARPIATRQGKVVVEGSSLGIP